MSEWTPEATEFLKAYLAQVNVLARHANEDAEEIVAGLRDHIVEKSERETGPLVTLEVLRRTLAEVGSPEAILETQETWRAAPTQHINSTMRIPPPPAAGSGQIAVTRDSSGKFLRYAIGCLILLIIAPIAIAILGMVTAILMPALSRSREAGHRAECANNLKQIVQAAAQYANDHQNTYPKRMTDLYPAYIKDIDIFACPSSGDTNRSSDQLEIWTPYEFIDSPDVEKDPNNQQHAVGEQQEILVREKTDNNHSPRGRNIGFKNGQVTFVKQGEESAFVYSIP